MLPCLCSPFHSHPGPVLRLGGNSADESCFNDDGHAVSSLCHYNITSRDLNAYRAFANKTAADLDISFVIDTDMGVSSNPQDVAVQHIKGLAAAGLWDIVHAVEVGNECDLFSVSVWGWGGGIWSTPRFVRSGRFDPVALP